METLKIQFEKEATEKIAEEMKSLREENETRKEEIRELKKQEVELLRKESKLKEKEEQLDLHVQKTLFEREDEIKQKVIAQEEEKHELKIKEYEKKFDDQKKLIEEMKRKSEQGSMQMQGEVQELALEEILTSQFPFDDIQPVPKGVKGADVVQRVFNEFQQECGCIVYESKRTKTFSDSWIEKLKDDVREIGASVSVIVTETLPKDMRRFGMKDGIWICTFEEVPSVSLILREMLLKEFFALSSVKNSGDKKELLYQYLVSDNFKKRLEGIVDGFIAIKDQIDHEKRAMQKIWKEREKQAEKVISNTIDMYGLNKRNCR